MELRVGLGVEVGNTKSDARWAEDGGGDGKVFVFS
jgi:hypothetical protein